MTNFEHNKFSAGFARIFLTLAMTAAYLLPGIANAAIDGVSGESF